MPDRSWTLLGSRIVSDHRIFRLREDRYRIEPAGVERDFVVLDGPDWINIVPLTVDRKVVLVRQYRHGVRGVTYEIPGGMANHGENPEAAGVRELREETGYVPGRVTPLGWVWPNPAIQNNRCFFCLAEDVVPDGDPEPDEYERIEVVTRPLDEIPGMVERGEIGHALVVLAFGLAGILKGPLSP
mgnify:CR=1 FL=1